jgi:hypothetical protein
MYLLDIFNGITATIFLLIGLNFKRHKNHSIFIFSFLIFVSNFVNPFLFMANEHMYAYSGWSAVRSFNFTVTSLIQSYSGSNFIYSLIVLILMSTASLTRGNKCRQTFSTPTVIHVKKLVVKNHQKSARKYLILICFTLLFFYYFLYNNQIGVTGLPGELPFHLSGIVHYIRAYLIPILLVILLNKSGGGKIVILTILIYAFVSGIAAASRFVGLLPMALLIMNFIRVKNYLSIALCLCYSLFIWFAISASRDLTFDGFSHNLVDVIIYSLTNIPLDNIINTLDLLTGRFSGAQQIVLVHQFRGHEDCNNIINFLLGLGSICTDTAAVIYDLDLSGTSYGLGLSLIPSIILSGISFYDYIIPVFFISLLIYLTQLTYQKLIRHFNAGGVAGLYLFLSILFIFLGQMLFFYYLQFSITLFLVVKFFYRKFRQF